MTPPSTITQDCRNCKHALLAEENEPCASCEIIFGRTPFHLNRWEPGVFAIPVNPPNGGKAVDHPAHYGGADNPYEAIKVIRAWNLGFNLGNTVKYISRAGKKDDLLQDLKKARWYLDDEIKHLEASDESQR